MGRKSIWMDKADKQQAYRERKEEREIEARQLAQRATELAEIAVSRGIIHNSDQPVLAQLAELVAWLREH